MSRKNKNLRWRFTEKSLLMPIILCIVGGAVAWMITQYDGDKPLGRACFYLTLVMAFSTFLGNVLPVVYWQWARKLCMLLLGVPLVIYLGIARQENPDVSGFMIYATKGILTLSLFVFIVTQIVLPLIAGRLWCGWGCYIMAIFEIMPDGDVKKGRLKMKTPVALLTLCAIIAITVVVLQFYLTGKMQHEITLFLFWVILLGYYVTGILMTIILKDNRAFCKYVCPMSVFQRFFSRFAFFKLAVDKEKCNRCMKCDLCCPMNIKIMDYADARERILSGDCTKCMICRQTCPNSAISTTFGLDCSFNESIHYAKRRRHH